VCQVPYIPYVFEIVEDNWVSLDAKAQAKTEGRDPCDLLKEWLNDEKRKSKGLQDKRYIRDVVQAQKYLKCRNVGKREENY
jgi:hypothetical protein